MTTHTTNTVPAFVSSLKRLLHTCIAIVETRFALLAMDLEQARAYLIGTVVLALLALVCIALSLSLGVLFVVTVFWESHRYLAIVGASLVLALLGLILLGIVKRRARGASNLFKATRDELGKDREFFS